MKYYLKEEFLHDINAKNAGNKARNDAESIVKEEGYHPLVLSVDNWYQMSTLRLNAIRQGLLVKPWIN